MSASKERIARTERAAPKHAERRDAVVNLRMSKVVRDWIDSAAAVLGKTRTDFIVESSRKQAIDVLLDQRLFSLSEDQFAAFTKALDEPPAPNKKLKALFSRKPLWEK